MTKDVLVSVYGLQKNEYGDEEPIEVITTGTYYFKNNKHYVLYDEMLEGTTDMCHSTLKFSEGELLLKRSGSTSMNMLFDTEEKTVANYSTPYGSLVVGVDTKDLKLEEKEDHLKVDVSYALDVNYEFFADCILKIEIKPRM